MENRYSDGESVTSGTASCAMNRVRLARSRSLAVGCHNGMEAVTARKVGQ